MRITPAVIASYVGGKVEGDGDCEITGFGKIEDAREGEISFISNAKYSHYAATTKASALIVSDEFILEGDNHPTLIRVENPYTAIATLLGIFAPKNEKKGIERGAYISETSTIGEDCYVGAFSYIGENAKIGRNVKIYPQSYVGDNVEIGDDSVVRPNVTIYEGCKIGERCILHAGCVIGADGFGFAPDGNGYHKIPQIGIVVIEDDVEIGANTTIDRATMGETRIGRGTKLDNLIQIAHNVNIGRNNVMAAQTGIAGSTKIGEWNRIGGQVGIAGHIKIGSHCEIGAQSGLNRGVRDNSRLIGYPATDLETFARNAVLQKKLYQLFKEVDEIKKELNKDKI